MVPFAPKRYDVICGRGGYRVHPGNASYHRLLRKCLLQLGRRGVINQDDDAMVEIILRVILEKRQGCFIRPDDDRKRFAVVLTRNAAAFKVELGACICCRRPVLRLHLDQRLSH